MRTLLAIVLLSASAAAQSAPSLQFRGNQESKHATIAAAPAAISGTPGSKIVLFVDVTPNANIHVYAPGSKDYIPITVKPEPQPQMKFGKVTYPKADIMSGWRRWLTAGMKKDAGS